MDRKKLLEQRGTLKAEIAKVLGDETREFGGEEQKLVDEMMAKLERLDARLAALERLAADEDEVEDEDSDEDDVEDEEDEDEGKGVKSKRNKVYSPAVIRSRGRKSADTIERHASQEGYSIARAVGSFCKREKLIGLEAEVDSELRRTNPYPCAGAFRMPFGDVRKLNRGYQVRADQTLTTGAGSIPTYWDAEMFIDYLYPILVGPKLGFDYMIGLAGVTKLPRQTAPPTVSAVAEEGSATGSDAPLDNVTLTPNTCTGNCTVSRKFATQSIIVADKYIMDTLAKQVGVTLDSYALNGTGSSNQPTGLFNNSAVTNYAYAPSNTLDWPTTVSLEKLVAEANADFGARAYLSSPAGWAKMRQTARIGSTFPSFIVDDNGNINGLPLVYSMQVPSTFSYSGTNNLTALAYGNWSDLIVAVFGNGLDILVDPFSGSKSGNVTITALIDMDTEVKRVGSFAICPNVQP